MSLDVQLSDERIKDEEYSKAASRHLNSKLDRIIRTITENAILPLGFLPNRNQEHIKSGGRYEYFKPKLATAITAGYEFAVGALLMTHSGDFSYSLVSILPGFKPATIFSVKLPSEDVLYSGLFLVADASRAVFLPVKNVGMYILEGVYSLYESAKKMIYKKDERTVLEAEKNAEPRIRAKYKLKEIFDDKEERRTLNKLQSQLDYYRIRGADSIEEAKAEETLIKEINKLREKMGLDKII